MEEKLFKNKYIWIGMFVTLIILTVILTFAFYTSYIKEKDITYTKEMETMEDKKLANIFYRGKKQTGFVNEDMEEYELYKDSTAASPSDAIKQISEKYSNNNKVTLDIYEETEYYYAIKIKDLDYDYENYYVVYKTNVFDPRIKKINLNILNNKNKIKEFLNVYEYTHYSTNYSIKLFSPSIKVTSTDYVYTYYYFSTIYGDHDISDTISLYKETIKVDRTTGFLSNEYKQIRVVDGR